MVRLKNICSSILLLIFNLSIATSDATHAEALIYPGWVGNVTPCPSTPNGYLEIPANTPVTITVDVWVEPINNPGTEAPGQHPGIAAYVLLAPVETNYVTESFPMTFFEDANIWVPATREVEGIDRYTVTLHPTTLKQYFEVFYRPVVNGDFYALNTCGGDGRLLKFRIIEAVQATVISWGVVKSFYKD